MRLLISGIRGFVGSNLVAAFKDRHEIYGLSRTSEPIDGVAKMYTWDNIRDGSLPEVDAIIHLAGKAHDVKGKSQADEYFRVNTGLTELLHRRFIQSSAKTFIFISSVKAAADTVPSGQLTEDVTPKPIGPYGESKHRAELLLLGQSPGPGQHIYILRPSMIHGPGNKGNLNLLYSVVNKGMPWPLGAYENMRSFTSIGNLSYIIGRLLESAIDSGIYNVSDDTPLSTNQLISIICQALNRKPRVWRVPKALISAAASLGTLLHFPLNQDRLTKLTENYVVSNSKLKASLSIDSMPIGSRQGLLTTLKSFTQS